MSAAVASVHRTAPKRRPSSPEPDENRVHGRIPKESKLSKHSSFRGSTSEKNEQLAIDDRRTLLKQGYVLLNQKLGAGKYCKVQLAETADTSGKLNSKQLAIKIIDTSKVRKEFLTKFLPREVSLWPRMDHPNLVRMHKYLNCGEKHYMILEYVSEGDLLTFIRRNGAQQLEKALKWTCQLISALSYMHAKKVAHRDLKLENILIDSDGNVKITDFGFCRQFDEEGDDERLSETFCGSKAYSCPEILAGIAYDPFKADVWSLGVVAFILVTGFMPFNENVPSQAAIIEAQRESVYNYPEKLNIPVSVSQSIDTMMSFEEDSRPNMEQVKDLPWFAGTLEHRLSLDLPLTCLSQRNELNGKQ